MVGLVEVHRVHGTHLVKMQPRERAGDMTTEGSIGLSCARRVDIGTGDSSIVFFFPFSVVFRGVVSSSLPWPLRHPPRSKHHHVSASAWGYRFGDSAGQAPSPTNYSVPTLS